MGEEQTSESNVFGELQFFKKNNVSGSVYPLQPGACTIGTDENASIRLNMKTKGLQPIHCTIQVDPNGNAMLINGSNNLPVKINGNVLAKSVKLKTGDLIHIMEKPVLYRNNSTVVSIQKNIYSQIPKRQRYSLLPLKRTAKTPEPVKVCRLKKKRSCSLGGSNKFDVIPEDEVKENKRMRSSRFSFDKAVITKGVLPSKNASTPQSKQHFTVGTPNSSNKPTLRDSNNSQHSKTQTTPTPFESDKKAVFTPVNNTSLVLIESPIDDIVKSRKEKTLKKMSESFNFETGSTPHLKTPRSIKKQSLKTPKSTLKKTKLMSELLDAEGVSSTPNEKNDRRITRFKTNSGIKPTELSVSLLEGNELSEMNKTNDTKQDKAMTEPRKRAILSDSIQRKKSRCTIGIDTNVKNDKFLRLSQISLPTLNILPRASELCSFNEYTDSTVCSIETSSIVYYNSAKDSSRKLDFEDDLGVEVLSESIQSQKSIEIVDDDDVNDSPSIKSPDYEPLSPSKLNESLKRDVQEPRNNSIDVVAAKRTPRVQKEPKNDLTNVVGIKRMLRTPRVQNQPKNDLTNVVGVRKLYKTPKVFKEIKNDLTNVAGVKRILRTPKVQKEPKNDLTKIVGVKKLLKTPKVVKEPKNDLTNVPGVKLLFKSPRGAQKQPKNDLTNVAGVKNLFQSPKIMKSPKNDLTNIAGVKRLLGTPFLVKDPASDLSDVQGVKRLLRTPKAQNPPKNDLSNVAGVKRLLGTPFLVKDPASDLSDVQGVKRLLRTPKAQNPPKNDLSNVAGVKRLLGTPFLVKDPASDLSQVQGVKRLLRTPKTQKPPKNDLSEISSISNLFEEVEVKKRKHNDDVTTSTKKTSGGHEEDDQFDSLIEGKALRVYEASPKKKTNLSVVLEKIDLTPAASPTTRSRRRIASAKKENVAKVESKSRKNVSSESDDEIQTVRSTRTRRNLQSAEVEEVQPSKTRGRKKVAEVIEEVDKVDELKVTTRGRKKVEENIEADVPKTRGGRQKKVEPVEVKKTPAKRGRRPKKASGEGDNDDEPNIDQVETKTSGRRVVKKNVEKVEEVEDEIRAPTTRRRGVRKNADVEVDKKKSQKKVDEELEVPDKKETKRRGKKVNYSEDKVSEDESVIEKSKKEKNTKTSKKIEDSEEPEPTKRTRGRKRIQVEEAETELPAKRSTRRK